MDKRAYSLLTIKAIDDDQRIITGIASTPASDLADDVVEPKGVLVDLPIPFLWQHNHAEPIGHVTTAKATTAGIEVTIKLVKVDEPPSLKERLDVAWQSIKTRLVRGLSIGFSSDDWEPIEGSWGRRYKTWRWLELSAVTIPCNLQASIQTIKSADRQLRAASGHPRNSVVRLDTPPGASGNSKSNPKPKPQEGSNMNVQEQIKQFNDQRAAKAARQAEIMKAAGESGTTLDASQEEEFDTLGADLATIDKHLTRLRAYEKSQAATATVVVPTPNPGNGNEGDSAAVAATKSRQGDGVIAVAKKLPPGVGFARYAGIMAAAKGSVSDAIRMAQEMFPEEKQLHAVVAAHSRIIKAPVDIGTTLDSDYAAPLVYARQLENEFIEFLRPQTILGRIPGLRRVPFNIRVPRQTTGGSAGWVGEAAPKGVTSISLDTVALKFKKLATIAVISEELARFSSPSAELIIRDTLAGAIVQQMDSDFVNPANAGTTDVKPASVTNGVSAVVSSGGTEADIITDIQAVFAPFITANLTPANGVWLMSATNALGLSLLRNALGNQAFPGITMTGGTFWGMPVIVSEAVGNIVVLLNASDILLADDGQVTIDTSREATLQMDSEPDNPATASTVYVSLFQRNLLAIRAERTIDWIKARAASVQYLSGVSWGTPTSP